MHQERYALADVKFMQLFHFSKERLFRTLEREKPDFAIKTSSKERQNKTERLDITLTPSTVPDVVYMSARFRKVDIRI